MCFSRSEYILKNWPTPGCHFSQITLMEPKKSVWLKEKSADKFQHNFQQKQFKRCRISFTDVQLFMFFYKLQNFFYNDRILGQASRKIGESVGSISRGPTPVFNSFCRKIHKWEYDMYLQHVITKSNTSGLFFLQTLVAQDFIYLLMCELCEPL